LLGVDDRALVSRADLVYRCPVQHPLEGQPIGNGVMGSMVWTTPEAVRLQINRCDVFAVNKNHGGRQGGSTDYCGACAKVTIDLGGRPFDASDTFCQRLSLYDAECTIAGEGVRVRCFVSAVTDVLVLEVDDQRPNPPPLRVTLWMWRPPDVMTGDHKARYRFRNGNGRVIVVQEFDQRDHHCASGVAVEVVGRDVQADPPIERARTLTVPGRQGKTTILVASAASWDPQADVDADVTRLLGEASIRRYDTLRQEHRRWWADFWSRTFVYLSSADGVADFVERVRALHLYTMAATSRGLFPPKWNGSLFTTEGDTRHRGAQFWVWTTEMHYFPLLAADAVDLTEPYFDMYVRQLPDCEKASLQRWGVEGAFYPETTPFDGPVVLPDDVGQEYQDVYLGRKSHLELSERARLLGQYDTSLRVFAVPQVEMAAGRYSWISHLVSSGCELAVQAWWRYRYTGDMAWLRTHAYPLLRATVEFYRHLAQRGTDGRYHICGTNVHEDFWGVNDSVMDLAAIRGTAPLAIRAAQILGVDAVLCTHWQELLDHLAPYPMGSDPEAQALAGGVLAEDVWAAGHLGDVDRQHNPEDVWLNPVFPFEDWTLESRDPVRDAIVQKTLDLAPRMQSILDGAKCNTAIRTPIAWARAGRGDGLPAVLATYYAAFAPLINAWSLFEGSDQSHSIEHLGCLTTAIQEALLQSVAAHPGESEIISVFPAWPEAWDGSFRLLARGGFLVTSSVRSGEVLFVEIESRREELCQLRNPWGRPCHIEEIGGAAQEQDGDLLQFETAPGKRYRVLPLGKSLPPRQRIAPEPETGPVQLSLTMDDGRTVRGVLGCGK
jgi:hypothetical protein